jgi:hypothetical protein
MRGSNFLLEFCREGTAATLTSQRSLSTCSYVFRLIECDGFKNNDIVVNHYQVQPDANIQVGMYVCDGAAGTDPVSTMTMS